MGEEEGMGGRQNTSNWSTRHCMRLFGHGSSLPSLPSTELLLRLWWCDYQAMRTSLDKLIILWAGGPDDQDGANLTAVGREEEEKIEDRDRRRPATRIDKLMGGGIMEIIARMKYSVGRMIWIETYACCVRVPACGASAAEWTRWWNCICGSIRRLCVYVCYNHPRFGLLLTLARCVCVCVFSPALTSSDSICSFWCWFCLILSRSVIRVGSKGVRAGKAKWRESVREKVVDIIIMTIGQRCA